MIIRENESLALHTTLRVGGAARYFIECTDTEDIVAALAFAGERSLPFYILGSGSNMLVSDAGYEGVVIVLRNTELLFAEADESGMVKVTAAAGVLWDDLVREAGKRRLWGMENLAGIPGTVGAAPVQNIGAYGAEVKDTLVSVSVFNTETGDLSRYSAEECGFAYRDSCFKHDSSLIIIDVTFALAATGAARVEYPDLIKEREAGKTFDTPLDVAEVVRAVRARKFPDLTKEGTGGSFFKNPFITPEAYTELQARYPGIPGFVVGNEIKIPLAWILDHVLSLRGYSKGPVRLFENQPLVLTAHIGATAADVAALAHDVTEKVFAATNIKIEREVRSL